MFSITRTNSEILTYNEFIKSVLFIQPYLKNYIELNFINNELLIWSFRSHTRFIDKIHQLFNPRTNKFDRESSKWYWFGSWINSKNDFIFNCLLFRIWCWRRNKIFFSPCKTKRRCIGLLYKFGMDRNCLADKSNLFNIIWETICF